MKLLLVAAVAGARAMILTRSKCRNVHPLVLATAVNRSLLPLSAIAIVVFPLLSLQPSTVAQAPFLLSGWRPLPIDIYGIMGILALLVVSANTSVAWAFQTAPPALVGSSSYIYLIFAVLWGWLLF